MPAIALSTRRASCWGDKASEVRRAGGGNRNGRRPFLSAAWREAPGARGEIARRAMSRGRYRMRSTEGNDASNGDGGWRIGAEPVARPWQPKREASCRRQRARRGRRRSEATRPRCASPGGWREAPAKGAERPSHGGGKAGSCRLHPRQGSSPERRRPRSGLRGAGRGEAAPGGIEPGDRSEGPGGRPYFPTGRADDTGP